MRLFVTGLLALMLSSGCLITQRVEASLGVDLIEAAKNGDKAEVITLLQSGADVNYAINCGGTALMSAVWYGHTEIVSMLLQHDAKVDYVNIFGATALMCAARRGHTEIVSMLLQSGANINVASCSNEATALICAAQDGHTETVSMLLQSSADVNHVDKFGETALTFATRKGHRGIVEKLQPLVRKHTKELCRKLEDKRFPNEMHVEIMKYVLDVSSRDKVDVLTLKWMHKLTADQMMLLYLFKKDARPVIQKLKDEKPNAMQLDFIGLPAQLQEAIIKKYDATLYDLLIKR